MYGRVPSKQRSETQYRLLVLVLSFQAIFDILKPGLLILNSHGWHFKISSLSNFPVPVWAIFFACAAGLLPNLFVMIFQRSAECNRRTTKISCAALCLASFSFLGLSYLARGVDRAWLLLEYTQNGVMCLALAAVLAVILNNDLLNKKNGVNRK